MLDLPNSKKYRCSDFSIQGQSWLKIAGDYRSFHRPYLVHYSVHIWHINVNWLYTRFNIDKMWPLMFLGEMLLFSWTHSLETVQVHTVSYVLSMFASCRTYLDQTVAILHQLPFGNILLMKPLILNAQKHLWIHRSNTENNIESRVWIMGLLCCSLFLCCLSVTNQVAFDDISTRWPGSVLVKEGSVGCELKTSFGDEISVEHNDRALKHKLLCTLNFTSLSLWTYIGYHYLWDAGTCGRSTKLHQFNFPFPVFSVVPHLNWNAKKSVNYL